MSAPVSEPRFWCTALLLALAALAGPANAVDEPALLKDVPQMVRSGKLDDAQRIVDRVLAANPKHVAARFQKSVLLTERGRSDEAIALLQDLAGEYPELPEPHNNLAVLYAAKGQYDNARVELANAEKADPGYPLASENLADVYVKLAELEYEKAAKLDLNNQAVRTKHNTLQPLVAPPKASAATPPAAAAPAPSAPAKPASR